MALSDNLEWEIGVLIDHYVDRKNQLSAKEDVMDFREFFKAEDELSELYSRAIILNVKHGYGIYYPIDDFIDSVKRGSYVDYDGIGYLLDIDGNKIGPSRCNAKWLEESKKQGAVYVSWFNN